MKKFLTIFFVSLGVIFFCILLALAYFWYADPYNIKPFITQSSSNEVKKEGISNNNTLAEDENLTPGATQLEAEATATTPSGLSEGQQNALELVGIDPTSLPSELTREQEQCFVEKFGQARVDEIKAGATPSAMEVLSGKNCL